MILIRDIPDFRHTYLVFRYVVIADIVGRLKKDGLSMEQISEVIAELNLRPDIYDVRSLITSSFVPSTKYETPYPQRRYSNGSFAACYTSYEEETAREEIAYHAFLGAHVRNEAEISTYYSLIELDFAGIVIDVRPFVEKWPNLLDPVDYGFCQQVGKEAKDRNLDALLAPSVRRMGGTNVPVFTEEAIAVRAEHRKRLVFNLIIGSVESFDL